MDRLFLDANVLFTAAHNPGGKAAFLFDALDLARWELLSSGYAIEEARRNLVARYPSCQPGLEGMIRKLAEVPQPALRPVPLELPDKDVPIFLAALGATVTHLLTGDLKHFGRYMNAPQQTGGMVIQTVANYLGEVARSG